MIQGIGYQNFYKSTLATGLEYSRKEQLHRGSFIREHSVFINAIGLATTGKEDQGRDWRSCKLRLQLFNPAVSFFFFFLSAQVATKIAAQHRNGRSELSLVAERSRWGFGICYLNGRIWRMICSWWGKCKRAK